MCHHEMRSRHGARAASWCLAQASFCYVCVKEYMIHAVDNAWVVIIIRWVALVYKVRCTRNECRLVKHCVCVRTR